MNSDTDQPTSTYTGTLIYGAFVGGRFIPSWLDSITAFPAPAYNELYDIVSAPLRISGPIAERILENGEIGLIDQSFKGRRWLPRQAFSLFQDGWLGVAQRATSLDRAHKDYRRHQKTSATENVFNTSDELFDFFLNGSSVFDCFNFAVFAAAAMLSPSHFKLGSPGDLSRVKL